MKQVHHLGVMLDLLGRIFVAPVRGCLTGGAGARGLLSAEKGLAIFELLPRVGWMLLILGACRGSSPVAGLVVGGSIPVKGNVLTPLVRGFAICENKLAHHAYVQEITHRKIMMNIGRSEKR